MSKVVRNQLLDAINLLETGTKYISKLITNHKIDDCTQLLTTCQELAIAIGTRIENLRGKGTTVVFELEDYCEKIYMVAAIKWTVGMLRDLKILYDK